jgi:hypothetical protein
MVKWMDIAASRIEPGIPLEALAAVRLGKGDPAAIIPEP